MLTKEEIQKLTQAMKRSVALSQKLIDNITEETEHEFQEVLDNTIDGAGLLRENNALTPDLLAQLRAVIQDVRNYNAANHEELITIPEGTDAIIGTRPVSGSGGSSTSTGSDGEHTRLVEPAHTGAGDTHAGHGTNNTGAGGGYYHAIDDHDHHVQIAGTVTTVTTVDGGCCGCW